MSTCQGRGSFNIGDEEVHYLKVLMDEIMPNCFVSNVLWQKRTSPDARNPLGDAHDHILVYAKNKEQFKENLNTLPLTNEQKERFKNPDNDPKGPWVSSDFTAQGYRPNQMYTIETPSGKQYSPPEGKCWKKIESEYLKLKEDGRMWFGKDGSGMPRRKTYLYESPGRVAWSWWDNKQVGHNQEAKKESNALFGASASFSTPKPERLIKQILSLTTDEGDIVLDFFMGSATTQAVSHKMKRQYIGVEQMDYINQFSVPRLRKVIEGEQGGVSEDVGW
ncbi:site-specific DNA-methyltransferase [Halobacillus fulvus]|nr:site-specific DNA-methyltransferase [Halobacillus fulvus]